jgi:hypothetical protein
MNITDVGIPKVLLNAPEAERLLSWLKCYPVPGREAERKSLEHVLEMAISLSKGQKPRKYEQYLTSWPV